MSYRGIPPVDAALEAFLRSLRDDVDRLQNGGANRGQISFDPVIRVGSVLVTVADDGTLTFTDAATGAVVWPNAKAGGYLATMAGVPAGTPGEVVELELADGSVHGLSWAPEHGKWVTPTVYLSNNNITVVTTAGTAYTIDRASPLMPWRVLAGASLTLEARVIASLTSGAASSIEVGVCTIGADRAGVQVNDTSNVTCEVTSALGTQDTQDSDWQPLNAAVTTRDFLSLALSSKRTGAANGTYGAGASIAYRWTYTPS